MIGKDATRKLLLANLVDPNNPQRLPESKMLASTV